MKSKLFKIMLSVMCGMLICLPYHSYINVNASTYASRSERRVNDDAPSKTLVTVAVIAVFTVTCAGSAVVTYKLRRKISQQKSEDSLSDSDNWRQQDDE